MTACGHLVALAACQTLFCGSRECAVAAGHTEQLVAHRTAQCVEAAVQLDGSAWVALVPSLSHGHNMAGMLTAPGDGS